MFLESHLDRLLDRLRLPDPIPVRLDLWRRRTLDLLDAYVAKLGADKNAPLIFACNGAECWKSYKACQQAAKAGYKQVYWFRGGFPEWNMAGMPTASLGTAVAQKK